MDYRLCREHRISVEISQSTFCIDIFPGVVVAVVSHFRDFVAGPFTNIIRFGALWLASLPRFAEQLRPRIFAHFLGSGDSKLATISEPFLIENTAVVFDSSWPLQICWIVLWLAVLLDCPLASLFIAAVTTTCLAAP